MNVCSTLMMADDLVFPPDDISSLIGDFDSNLSEDILRTDINPSFPHSELLNFPQILPPMINSTDPRRAFQNAHVTSNSVGSTYTPISQLMKQTEELTSTLGSPLSSSLNQQVNFSNIVDTTSPNNQTVLTNNAPQTQVTGNMNFVNSHAPKNTQYLVVGGQRIIQQQNLSNSQQRQHTALHSPGAPSLSITSSNISNNSLSINNKAPLQQSFQPPTTNVSNQPKQSLVLKMPVQQQILQTGLPGQKGPLKGSLIKTANQQIMFVTEVNGKKVGYVIQHPKPNNLVSSNSQPTPNVSVAGSSASSITAPSAPVSLSLVSPATNNASTNHLNNLNNSSPQNATSEKLINKNQETKSIEMTKLLRERLQGLRSNNNINFKNQLNLKQQALGLSKNDKNTLNNHDIESKDIRVSPVTQNVNPVSKILSDFDSVLTKPDTGSKRSSLPQQTQTSQQTESMEFIDDEDGQEIEFSENDLTAENNEDSDDPIITSISAKECNEIEDITENNIEDDDSDSMPLALLRTDTFEEPISIIREKDVEKPTKKVKKLNRETSDSLPLSVVAASLKKDQEDGKGKKRGRKKKKKKDEDEPIKPILAYQVFFKEAQQKLKEENPMYKENFGELSKKIGHLWEVLDPEKKKVYQENYNKVKAEYMIKLAEYKDKKAKEIEELRSPVSVDEFHDNEDRGGDDDDEDENVSLKKTATKKIKKKSPARKKVTLQTIATTTTLSPPLNILNEETNETFPDSIEDVKPLKRKYNKSKKSLTSAPSPSPPSSDTEEDSSEEEDSEISRIRELAAKARKQLKKIEKQSVKGKSKDTSKKSDRVVKMEVETISENTIIEHPSNEIFLVPESKIEKVDPTPPSPLSLRSANLTTKTKGKITSKEMVTSDEIIDDEEDKVNNVLLSPTSPKTTFKIPKRNNGDKIQAQGPRLCVRETCSSPVKATRERGAQYCSNECLVLYCREVFDSWVIDRQNEDT